MLNENCFKIEEEPEKPRKMTLNRLATRSVQDDHINRITDENDVFQIKEDEIDRLTHSDILDLVIRSTAIEPIYGDDELTQQIKELLKDESGKEDEVKSAENEKDLYHGLKLGPVYEVEFEVPCEAP